MHRLLVALLVAAALAPVAGAAAPSTSLTITVWPEGTEGPSYTRTLRCGPAGGTLRTPAAACRRLAQLTHPFRPVPEGSVCTMIYGGPQVALVRGRYAGRSIWTKFRRANGCEIARWDRVAFLFRR